MTRQTKFTAPKGIAISFVLAIFLLSLVPVSPALTRALIQTDVDQWSSPENISRSGGATNPIIVNDYRGRTHVLWQDISEKYMYSYLEAGEWSSPINAPTPFNSLTGSKDSAAPLLIAHPNGLIYAFWIFDNTLYTSRITADRLTGGYGWDTVRKLASNAIAYDVAINDQNDLYITYVRSLGADDVQAGIYFAQSPNGADWTGSSPVHLSPYYRTLTPDIVNISLATITDENETSLYLTWDLQPRKQVLFIRSVDSGRTWEEAEIVDMPDRTYGDTIPYRPLLNASGEDLLLLWEVGEPLIRCKHNYITSTDGGSTWSRKQEMEDYDLGCFENAQFLPYSPGMTLLMAHYPYNSTLQAWNGSEWSSPEILSSLTGFIDPDTFDQVEFSCLYSAINQEMVQVVGCDQGFGSDIWFTQRRVGSYSDWYPEKLVWSDVGVIYTSIHESSDLNLMADQSGGLHAVWIQKEESIKDSPLRAIYYAHLVGNQWSQPKLIIRSESGEINALTSTIDENGNILMLYSENDSTALYFSRANADFADSINEWTDPERIPLAGQFVGSFNLEATATGKIYAIYAIPFNEARGIYISYSDDTGMTWNEPVQILNGSTPEWEQIALTELVSIPNDGSIFAAWGHFSLPPYNKPLALFMSSSSNLGVNWEASKKLVDSPVNWWRILETGGKILHLFWQADLSGQIVLLHQYSADGGNTWSNPSQVTTNIGGWPEGIDLAVDQNGYIHLINILEEEVGDYSLQHMLWNGSQWSKEEGMNFYDRNAVEILDAEASVTSDGTLGVLFSTDYLDQSTQEEYIKYYYAQTSLDLKSLPRITPTQLASIKIPTSTPTISATRTPAPSPTPDISTITSNQSQNQEDNLFGIIIGGGLSALFILIAIFGRWQLSKNRRP